MPRRPRGSTDDCPYHVWNRAVRRVALFENDEEYGQFEELLLQNLQRRPIRLLAYCAMPNHWHMVLWPLCPTDLPRFMHRFTGQLADVWHEHRGTRGTGPVYQGRYKAGPVDTDESFLNVCRYVERNPLAAGLVSRAEEWRWSSLWRRQNRCGTGLLADWPVPVPSEWLASINRR